MCGGFPLETERPSPEGEGFQPSPMGTLKKKNRNPRIRKIACTVKVYRETSRSSCSYYNAGSFA